MKEKLLLLIISLFSLTLNAQDTEFWFAAPDLSEADNCGPKDSPLALAVSNGTVETANIQITFYNGGSPKIVNATIAPNDLYWYYIVNADKILVENPRSQAGNVTSYGIHITSDVRVTAYYQVLSNCNQDIYALKGSSALGTDFYVPMGADSYYYTGSDKVRFAGACDQIDIVATEDGTTVTVVPRQEIRIGVSSSSPAGTSITRTLNKGQTLKIMEHVVGNWRGSPSLGGTKVTSDKPIAITTSEDLIGGVGTGQDLIGDQIVPVDALGKTYVVPKGYLTGSERIYMIASASGTNIEVNDGSIIKSYGPLNAGDTCTFNMGDNGFTGGSPKAVLIDADKPIYCYHVTGYKAGGDELGSALLPSIYSIGQTQLSYYQYQAVSSDTYHAFVVFRSGTGSDFTISYNGTTNPLSVTPIPVPGLSDWQTAKINLPAAASNNVVTIRNPNSAFSFGYFTVNTSSGGSSYGYLSAFGDFKFPYDTIYRCGSSPMSLEGGYAKYYTWTLPDGSTQEGSTLSSIPVAQSGTYKLEMNQDPRTITDSCHIFTISYNASIKRNSSGPVVATSPVSFSADINPIKGLKLDYEWNFSDGAVPSASTTASPTVIWYEGGSKTVSLKLTYTGTLGDVCDTTLVYDLTIDPKVVTGGTGKSATVNGISDNGTAGSPVLAYHTDQLVYTITAVNNSPLHTNVSIYDTIPNGLQILYISDGGVLKPGTPRVVFWDNLAVATNGGTKSVYIVTTPFIGAGANQLLYVNKATIIYDDGGTVVTTNETYHRASAFPVTFIVGDGGTISNGVTQVVDYQGHPYAGVTANADPGYTFTGWSYNSYTDRNGVTQPGRSGIMDYRTVQVLGDMVLRANFELNRYAISYHDIERATFPPPPNPIVYNITHTSPPDGPITLTNPDSTGYTFIGWTGSNGDTPQRDYIIPKGTTGNLSYIANWAVVDYTITYDYNGGTASTPNPAYYNTVALPITIDNSTDEPIRIGYIFDGWTGDLSVSHDKIFTILAGTTGDLRFTAEWLPESYTITYNYNGGTPTSSEKLSYDITETPFQINNEPILADQIFVGWTGSNGTIPELEIKVPAGTTGNLNYYANWAYQFPADTISECEPPRLLHSGHDGLSYEWILPDGSHQTTEDIEAIQSGIYILRTNYGSMIISDTAYVLIFFPQGFDMRLPNDIRPKTDVLEIFSAVLDPMIKDVNYQWTFEGGTPATSTDPSPSVTWSTEGRKRITLRITAKEGGLTCVKTLANYFTIYGFSHGLFVDQHVNGGLHDGSSWKNAFITIQEALLHAKAGDYIWVAKGEYKPDPGSPYMMNKDGVEIYGGFAAWEEYLSQRDVAGNPTIVRGSGTSVISTNNVSSSARWDGFIVEGGTASNGAGVINSFSSVTLANMIIRGNTTTGKGGGVYSLNGNPVLFNVEVSGNKADSGAAMYNEYAHALLTNVTISGNKAVTGGGFFNKYSSPEIRNTILWGNRAETGSSVYNEHSSSPSYSYSLVEMPLYGSGSWDYQVGINKENNLIKNPAFVKNGFDDAGNMQAGDYMLTESSPAIDHGYNSFLYELTFRDVNLQQLTGNILYHGLPYDLAGKERIHDDRVDMGAYESKATYIDPEIQRYIDIPSTEGVVTEPGAGKHYVKGHHDFTFTVSYAGGLPLKVMAKGAYSGTYTELTEQSLEDDKYKYVIRQVVEPWTITFGPDLSSSITGEGNIEGLSVWTYKTTLYIHSDSERVAYIYNMSGSLCKRIDIKEGDTKEMMDQGVYVVVIEGVRYKLIVK
ncbi:MAG: InlB B-repeat-containing protein [Tannerella sp.]|jgi:uncharacterized repeat protein (TIGR02543 family)/uncharacterized repeat protein (TIGR01451 family)|nr:InlB B-repeat-containing protein [Tannerella sp.]